MLLRAPRPGRPAQRPFPPIRLGRPPSGPRFPLVPVVIGTLFIAAVVVLVLSLRPGRKAGPGSPAVVRTAPACSSSAVRVLQNEIMPGLLKRAGLPGPVADTVIATLRMTGFNMHAMRPGDSVEVVWQENRPVRLFYFRSYEQTWRIDIDSADCRASTLLRDITARTELLRGSIAGSLYEALLAQGEKPALIADYTDIFGWEVDFFSETQPGDSFVILVQKRFADSAFVGYGPVLAARYRGQVGDFAAFRFTDPAGNTDFYNRDGQSLRKTFLKSPLRFSRISSFFGSRRHPILRVRRQHHGLDYVAPTGTPVCCVADGRVTVAGWSGGYGKLVEVAHPNGFVTRYGHLSRFGKGIKRGVAVKQGDVIGQVGSTGLSTGSHLHYEVRKFGASTNPLRLNPPRAAPVRKEFVPQFQAARDSLSALLYPLPTPPPDP